MNLVQINERLKEMPLQAVQQYANGANPMVPPYLALGEIQRREKVKQQMAMERGAQGQQPSVKEQIEQKAGLMGLQQAQMQQQQQQMMQPRPGPVPAGTPQPQPQPEEVAMAGGGLAAMPVRDDLYRFAGGGIIAFQEGGSTISSSGREIPLTEEERKRLAEELRMRILAEEERTGKPASPRLAQITEQDLLNIPGFQRGDSYSRAMRDARGEPAPERPSMVSQIPTGGYPQVTGGERVTGSELDRNVQNTLAAMPGAAVMKGPTAARMAATGLAGLLGGGARVPEGGATPEAQAPRPTPAPEDFRRAPFQDPRRLDTREGRALALMSAQESEAGRPAAPARVPPSAIRPAGPSAPGMQATQGQQAPAGQPDFLSQAAKSMTPQTMEEAIAERKKLQEAFAPGQYGEDAIKRMQDRRRQYEAGKPSGLDELIRVLGQAGQYKGLSGLGPAYTQLQAEKRANDLRYAQQEEALLSEIDKSRRAEGLTGVTGVSEDLRTGRTRAAQTAATLGAQQMQTMGQMEIAKLDRLLRERLHNTPLAQTPSVEREMLDIYTKKFGGDRAKAFEHIRTLLQENKAELSQPQLVRQYADTWAKMDPAARMSYEKQGIKSAEDYINYMTRITSGATGGAKSGKTPALPAGFKLD